MTTEDNKKMLNEAGKLVEEWMPKLLKLSTRDLQGLMAVIFTIFRKRGVVVDKDQITSKAN